MSDTTSRSKYGRFTAFILLGMLVGAVAGYALYWIFKLKGPWPFAIGGALVGSVAFGAFPFLQKASKELVLQEMTLQLPHLGEVTLAIDDSQARVAWKLFVETTTRVATQPLGSESGFLREALDSLYSLFSTTRDLLKSMQPAKQVSGSDRWTVEMIAVAMLNQELRPFLSRWHPALTQFERRNPNRDEREWTENKQCREDLEQTREVLIRYARGFGELVLAPV